MESRTGNDNSRLMTVLCVGIVPGFVEQLTASCDERFDIKSCDAGSTLAVGVQIALHQPSIVLISEDLLCEKGVSLLHQLGDLDYQSAIVILGKDMNAATIAECIPLGLVGLIDPQSPFEQIVRALEAICGGEVWVPRHRLVEAVNLLTAGTELSRAGVWNRLPALTEREHEVFVKMMGGLSNREISECLGISCDTVKVHLKHIFSKLGVHRRSELLSQRL